MKMEDNNISAFAFKTGRLIEELINKENNNLKEENQMLQARILHFYAKLKDDSKVFFYTPDLIKDYEKNFNVATHYSGKVGE